MKLFKSGTYIIVLILFFVVGGNEFSSEKISDFFENFCLAQGESFSIPKPNMHLAHSHNDYKKILPFYTAYWNQFYSFEADIWLNGNEIIVGHKKNENYGKLKNIYLEPMKKALKDKDSLYGDGKQVILWIDFKEDNPLLLKALHQLLSNYDFITTYNNQEIINKPVLVVLTGKHNMKLKYVNEFTVRYATMDSNSFSTSDPAGDSKWTWYSLKYSSYLNGKEKHYKLSDLVNLIHSKGKKVRFYGTPDNETYWELELKAGVDLINTDKILLLRNFLLKVSDEPLLE